MSRSNGSGVVAVSDLALLGNRLMRPESRVSGKRQGRKIPFLTREADNAGSQTASQLPPTQNLRPPHKTSPACRSFTRVGKDRSARNGGGRTTDSFARVTLPLPPAPPLPPSPQ